MESKLPSGSDHSTGRAGAPVHFIRLTLTNFGPFREMAVDFQPSGVFVVSGLNASGKSQLLGVAVAAIVGKRAIALDPTGVGPSNVALELGDGSAREVASLTVSAVAARPGGRGPQSETTHTSTPTVRDWAHTSKLQARKTCMSRRRPARRRSQSCRFNKSCFGE
jgi:hypothetical protein